ncbi:hypothetical protein MHC_00715 [Mycoplasma haemocanis str. Illinois]|uniref:Uncharacterized protein n=1 Tax=Mycoplasma haemocanis (strain Illinois) TaxID=1111676 RepID=H6N5P9_MYCHN|nr:hypothetical protein [Mycoplasma haemocanis]AEW45009.1 hypothetical protein MHC_00715 [Mycoplasma haemocanis str. Illinois]
MTAITKVGIGLASCAGVTGTGIVGVHYHSVETIGSKIKNSVLGIDKDFDDAWSDQFKKLEQESEITGSLKTIKDKYKGNNKEGGQAVKRWCQRVYESTYKSKLMGPNEDYLKNAKKFCILTLSERLSNAIQSSDKILSFENNTDESSYKSNYDKIKSHDDNTMGALPKELSDLRNHQDQSSTKWNVIQSFCKKKIPTPFTNMDDFKIVKKYCTKDSST